MLNQQTDVELCKLQLQLLVVLDRGGWEAPDIHKLKDPALLAQILRFVRGERSEIMRV